MPNSRTRHTADFKARAALEALKERRSVNETPLLDAFKAKVKAKPVDFWKSKEELHGKVGFALTKVFYATPRPGWIRATGSLGPEVAQELSRLSKENADLKAALADPEVANLERRKKIIENMKSGSVTITVTAEPGQNGQPQANPLAFRVSLLEAFTMMMESFYYGIIRNLSLEYPLIRTLVQMGLIPTPQANAYSNCDTRVIVSKLIGKSILRSREVSEDHFGEKHEYVLTDEGSVIYGMLREELESQQESKQDRLALS